MLIFFVSHKELEIYHKDFQIKASLKIPANKCSRLGVLLSHGGIINRQSLIRTNNSFADYLCDELDAYIIVPDLQGETIHKNGTSYNNFSKILNIVTGYFAETYNLEEVFGFGHSMGCFVLAQALQEDDYISSIVNYGGPIRELKVTRQKRFFDYLVRYLSDYDYNLNIRNLLKYIFDDETCMYLEDVMLKEEEYNSSTYDFNLDSSLFMDLKKIIDDYINYIKEWNKPALLLFGTEDGVTRKTLKFYKDSSVDGNILFKHIQGASHVTPCMSSHYQLSKLEPIISFYKQIYKIDDYQKILAGKRHP